MLAVLKNEPTREVHGQDRDELLGIAQLAQEFGFRPGHRRRTEGWTMADELGRAGALRS